MKKGPFQTLTLIVALILTILGEFIVAPLDGSYGIAFNIVCSLITIFISLLLEKYLNKKKFERSLISSISSLKLLRKKHNISSDAIQDIMLHVTSEMANVLDYKLNEAKPSQILDKPETLICQICTKSHTTDHYSKCQKCKINRTLWQSINESLKQ